MSKIFLRSVLRRTKVPAFVLASVALLCGFVLVFGEGKGAGDFAVLRFPEVAMRVSEVPAAHTDPLPVDVDANKLVLFTSTSLSHDDTGRYTLTPDLGHLPSEPTADPLLVPFEQDLMGGRLLTEKSKGIVMSEVLASPLVFDAYEADVLHDQDAIAQTNLYGHLAQRAIASSGADVRLTGFACGIRLCVGALSGGTDQDYLDWTSLFLAGSEFTGTTLNTTTVSSDAGAPTLNFAFWVDHP